MHVQVRLLSEAGLVQPNFNVPELMARTLPPYLFPPAGSEGGAAAPSAADALGGTLPGGIATLEHWGGDAAEEAEEAEAEAEAAEEEGAGGEGGEGASKEPPKPPTPAELAAAAQAQAEADAAMMERLEATFSLEMIYVEFEAAMAKFASHLADPAVPPPWAPTPDEPAAEPAEGEGAEAEAAETDPKLAAAADEGAAEDEEGAEGAAEGAAEAAEAPPPPTASSLLAEKVLPPIGAFLEATLRQKASVAD